MSDLPASIGVITGFDANAAVGSDASEALRHAAAGNLEAQRSIRNAWSSMLASPAGQGPDSDLTDAGGILIARLCAAHGDRSDTNMLAMLLLNVGTRLVDRGRTQVGWQCVAEALSLYERLGHAGDQGSIEAVKALLPELPIEVIAHAKTLTLKGSRDGSAAAPVCIRAVH